MNGERSTLHVVFAGGGTAGHLFPGLAVAQRLVEQTPGLRITFLGSGKPLECGSVASAGFDYLAVPCRAMPRRWWEVLPSVWTNAAGYLAARRWLAHNACEVVVGLGGYVSAATARAALDVDIPLVLLEQNAVPGRVTRWLSARAAAVCVAFEEAQAWLPSDCRVVVTGNPIRTGFAPYSGSITADVHPRLEIGTTSTTQRLPRLLILGGTAGSRSLNRSVPKTLEKMRPRLRDWEIVHQSGPAGYRETEDLYRQLGLTATVVPFVVDMSAMLAGAELVVCRAGGTTLAELATAGVPAILVPYPHAADDHQRSNALVLARHGTCVMLEEGGAGDDFEARLADVLARLIDDRAARRRMGAAMRELARPDATSDVAAVIRQEFGVRNAEGGRKRKRRMAA